MLTRFITLAALTFAGLTFSGCADAESPAVADDAEAADEELITGPYQEEVTPTLSRSSQPHERWIQSLKERGFRSVVNLRAEDNSEAPIVRGNGMVAKHIPVVDHQLPTMDQVREFLDFATRAENQPVLVHCQAGKGRTGFFVAAYRISVQGWSVDDALAEGVDHGMSRSKGEMLRRVESDVRRSSVTQ